MPPAPTLSVVIPTLNAAAHLRATLASLGDGPMRDGPATELLVTDGGSADETAAIAGEFGARVIAAQRGRGSQLAAGVAAATGDWLLLLHADTRLGVGWRVAVTDHIATCPERAGYFRFALDSTVPQARRLEHAVAWRCRVFALPYGDQGLLIHRTLLHAVGGMRALPLMEDVDLARRLGRSRLRLLDAPAVTSAGKWERQGWYRRSVRNLGCLALYFLGLPPRLIARLYG